MSANEKICLFAGTTEGRRLAEYLGGSACLTVCVATEYGEIVLDGIVKLNIRAGRMDVSEMVCFFADNGFTLIIDATHPYAELVTDNIKAAAAARAIRLIRILREADRRVGRAAYVSSVSEAKAYLSNTDGSILITTGSKEIAGYAGLDTSRVYARVLPTVAALEACAAVGIEPPHIIAEQGPFSEETNLALLHAVNAKYIVTKDSGKNGGFDEKISAAEKAGVIPVIIGRPKQNEGVYLNEALRELSPFVRRRVYIIGAGVGSEALLTSEAKEILRRCDVIVGAKRVTDSLLAFGKPTYNAISPEKISEYIASVPEYRNVAAVMSGDVGFYSGAKKLTETLDGYDVKFIAGISSAVYFAAKLGVPWDDAALVSLHGREQNIVHAVSQNRRVIALTGGDNSVGAVCRKLCEYGLGGVTATVGERLSYPDEKITKSGVSELAATAFDPLSIMYIENETACIKTRHGISDDEFLRGDVPMTKAEVRSITLAKLALDSTSIVYDVGAGTGSVSVECALAAYNGTVYAIEKKREAVDLIVRNAHKFGTSNIIAVEGEAPGALEGLPAPTHAFIGGSSGNMREIIAVLLKKNPDIRIVVNAVTLETLTEARECIKAFGFRESETVLVNISRSKKLGGYNMMTAQNPVYVITMAGGANG